MKVVIEELEPICGGCCHFKYEDMEGWGQCVFAQCGMMHCSDLCTCDRYVSETQKRHYMATLRVLQRRLNKPRVSFHREKAQSVKEAIDFLIEYSKLY